ncbi:DUF3280 domain-containing protein [Methylobacterium sp. WSM2598]|uniref:DUF3280 domain-containing protein n=1 Tax=Methylobacterium sp. WSM2598 TaxID=398261 RepID=UPI00036EE802|nr:DUF3280 domain-containing protein [Methylobacterium sp. WSM2598]
MIRHVARLAAALTIAASAASAAVAAPRKAAVFDFQFANLGASPPTEADLGRLGRLTEQLRAALQDSGRYAPVPLAAVAQEAAKSDLRHCNGCAEDLARKAGAEVAITGEVQKVSNLILNINVYVKDVDSAAPERGYSVDIRGDTDESFERGLRYLIRNKLLAQ